LDYIKILQDEFQSRKNNTPSFSIRKFASLLEVSPATLSEVLRGKKGLSQKMAVQICQQLELGEQEKFVFIKSVIAKHSRVKYKRLEARKDLNKAKDVEAVLNKRRILISSSLTWQPMVIFSTLHAYGKLKKDRIIELTRIQKKAAESSLSILETLKVIEKDKSGFYAPLCDNIFSESEMSSSYIKNYHRSILEYALSKIPQDIDQRYLQSLILPLTGSQKKEAQKEIDAFLKKMVSKFDLQKNAADVKVHQLSIQLFNFNQNFKKEKK